MFSFAHLTLLCFGLWLRLLACSSTEQSPVEKAITYQADCDWGDDVQYHPFVETVAIVGKPRVLTYPKKVIAQHQISLIRPAEFTSIPLHTPFLILNPALRKYTSIRFAEARSCFGASINDNNIG